MDWFSVIILGDRFTEMPQTKHNLSSFTSFSTVIQTLYLLMKTTLNFFLSEHVFWSTVQRADVLWDQWWHHVIFLEWMVSCLHEHLLLIYSALDAGHSGSQMSLQLHQHLSTALNCWDIEFFLYIFFLYEQTSSLWRIESHNLYHRASITGVAFTGIR